MIFIIRLYYVFQIFTSEKNYVPNIPDVCARPKITLSLQFLDTWFCK